MYSLDLVLRPDFSRSWQEAVAVTQEVARALGDLKTLPAPEDLFLEEDATVAIGFASEEPGDPVSSLASLLLRLLEGVNAPAELLSLAADNAKTPPAHPTVAGFTRALAFYERPDRQSDVRAVVTRLAARRAALTSEQELKRLRQRIASSDDENEGRRHPGKKRVVLPFKLPRVTGRQAAIAASVLVALLGTLAGAVLAGGRLGRPVEASTEEAAPSESPRPTAAAPAVREEVAPAARPTPASAAPVKPQPAAKKQATLRTSAPSPSLSALRAAAPSAVRNRPTQFGASIAPVAPLRSSAVSATATIGIEPGPAADDSTAVHAPPAPRAPIPGYVYSAAEPNVMPARLTRSQLPHEPAATAETGYFDMVIDEKGDVESVKLLSPTRRYYDRMLVAAAKAWKFRPALFNGTPVKYRLRIPIILSDIPR